MAPSQDGPPLKETTRKYSKIYLLQLYTLCVCGTVDIYKYDAKTVDASQSILLRCVCIYDFI